VSSVLVRKYAPAIRRIARRHGVTDLRVFGSHAAGQAHATSDLDLLVALRRDRDLLDLAEFKLDVEELLGCKVDVVTDAGLSPYLREEVIHTSKPL
jgi:predicted nucleotidyltransferase